MTVPALAYAPVLPRRAVAVCQGVAVIANKIAPGQPSDLPALRCDGLKVAIKLGKIRMGINGAGPDFLRPVSLGGVATLNAEMRNKTCGRERTGEIQCLPQPVAPEIGDASAQAGVRIYRRKG